MELYTLVISELSSLGQKDLMMKYFTLMVAEGKLSPTPAIFDALLAGYRMSSADVDQVDKIWNAMTNQFSIVPSAATYKGAMASYFHAQKYNKVIQLTVAMRRSNIPMGVGMYLFIVPPSMLLGYCYYHLFYSLVQYTLYNIIYIYIYITSHTSYNLHIIIHRTL